MEIGTIVITYSLDDEGDVITDLTIEGDLPVVTQIGLLEMAKDTILHDDPIEN